MIDKHCVLDLRSLGAWPKLPVVKSLLDWTTRALANSSQRMPSPAFSPRVDAAPPLVAGLIHNRGPAAATPLSIGCVPAARRLGLAARGPSRGVDVLTEVLAGASGWLGYVQGYCRGKVQGKKKLVLDFRAQALLASAGYSETLSSADVAAALLPSSELSPEVVEAAAAAKLD